MKFNNARLIAIAVMLAIASVFCSDCVASGKSGQKSFGPYLGFVSRNTSATAGLKFDYRFSKVVRLAPEIGLIFRHHDLDGLAVDVNVHFPLEFAGGRAAFYPLVGAAYTSWGRHNIDSSTLNDVTTHANSLGLNAGAGIEYLCKPTLKLSAEARYTLMRHYPTAYIVAGIAFVF